MSDLVSDPNRDGSYQHHLNNAHGKTGRLGIESGLTPKVFLRSAGYGVNIVAADGSTVILSVSETGVYTPVTMGVPTKADPLLGDDAQIYKTAGGVLKYFDGTNAVEIVTAP